MISHDFALRRTDNMTTSLVIVDMWVSHISYLCPQINLVRLLHFNVISSKYLLIAKFTGNKQKTSLEYTH